MFCKYCKKPSNTQFCSDYCLHRYKLMHDRSYQRALVWLRDRGICSICGVDANDIKNLSEMALKLNRKLPRRRKTAWDVHHMVDINCDIFHLKTVCLFCHQDLTQIQREQREESLVYEFFGEDDMVP